MRLAALNLCNTTIRKINKFDDNIEELLKMMISNGLTDINWEIRDSILEILNLLLARFEEGTPVSLRSFSKHNVLIVQIFFARFEQITYERSRAV